MIKNDLPYFSERTEPIDTLVLHCLAYDVEKGLETFHQAQVSAHYMIDMQGRIHQLVPENKCAWHAGKSFWRGRDGLNKYSIGIEVYSPSLGQESYSPKQIFALIRLCRRLIKRYHIKPQNIVGHSDIAPTRKPDPGKAFPWAYLARHGIGKWYKSKHCHCGDPSAEEQMLAAIGYDVSDFKAAQWAFCRHFVPELVPENKNIIDLINQPIPQETISDKQHYLSVLQAVYNVF